MLKKFTEGLIFGGGFAIAFVIVWYGAAYFIYPMFANSYVEKFVSNSNIPITSNGFISQQPGLETGRPPSTAPIKQFYELELEEQIEKSSVIALAKYKPGPDGTVKAIITEILKKDPDASFYYKIGDEYRSSSYTPEKNTRYGDGVVIFFVGSPATSRMSTSYFGDRIHSLGDIPLELFKNKCKQPDA